MRTGRFFSSETKLGRVVRHRDRLESAVGELIGEDALDDWRLRVVDHRDGESTTRTIVLALTVPQEGSGPVYPEARDAFTMVR